METMLLCACPICGRGLDEGARCPREAWLLRRRELLRCILAGMGVALKAGESSVLLVDSKTGHKACFSGEVEP
jgi:hypothetical protein